MRQWILLLLLLAAPLYPLADVIRVGSKNFNESYVLGEIAAQMLEAQGFEVERKLGLGGTLICYEALRNGEIDLYVEYTGTLTLTDTSTTSVSVDSTRPCETSMASANSTIDTPRTTGDDGTCSGPLRSRMISRNVLRRRCSVLSQ